MAAKLVRLAGSRALLYANCCLTNKNSIITPLGFFIIIQLLSGSAHFIIIIVFFSSSSLLSSERGKVLSHYGVHSCMIISLGQREGVCLLWYDNKCIHTGHPNCNNSHIHMHVVIEWDYSYLGEYISTIWVMWVIYLIWLRVELLS